MLLPMERERAMERALGAILHDSGDTSVMHSASSPPDHRGNSSPGIVLCTSGRGSSSCFLFRGSLEVFGISVDVAVCQPNSVARPASNAWIQTGRRIRFITSTAHTSGIHALAHALWQWFCCLCRSLLERERATERALGATLHGSVDTSVAVRPGRATCSMSVLHSASSPQVRSLAPCGLEAHILLLP